MILGLFPIPAEAIFHHTGCDIQLDFYYTYEFSTLTFVIIVDKDDRRLNLTQTVNVLQGDPPEVDVTSDR